MALTNLETPQQEHIAQAILAGFNRHFAIFQEITQGARQRFEAANWQAVQQSSRERIVLYDQRVYETVVLIKELYRLEALDDDLWKQIKRCYMRLLSTHSQPELAETFYNSVFCRLFHYSYYTNEFIFVRNVIATDYMTDSPAGSKNYHCYYPGLSGIKQTFAALLQDSGFSMPFVNFDKVLWKIKRRLMAQVQNKQDRQAHLNLQLQVISQPFFRNKGAYIVGKYINGRGVEGFALAVLNNEQGQLYIDALLIGEKELSLVFSYSQAYFMIAHQVPSAIVSFLKPLLPERHQSELYSAIGFHKQGKADFYRHFLHHLDHSGDHFIEAPGIRGMVMMVFTLPSYRYVFKIIKDHFAPQKDITRQQVEERYQLVKRHDRVGRMADMLEYSDVTLPLKRFSPELLSALQDTCASSISIEDDAVIFKHIYIERRMMPLNMFIKTANEEELEHAIKDYGDAIKQLAAANIFPGDFLYKNFGLTQLGRVVFYDYDEITYMTECHFRKIPPPRFPEDLFSAEPWYSIAPNDVFPEEFATFLLTNPDIRRIFMKYHKDLLDYRYWQEKQQRIKRGVFEDVYPYSESLRFTH